MPISKNQATAILRRFAFIFACFTTLNTFPSQSESLGAVSGRIILTVTGKISVTNAKDEAQFDIALLESLSDATLVTSTLWTDGPIRFEGVWAQDLLKAVGATGNKVVALALNDYQVEIPLDDFSSQKVLLALKMNGIYMRVRDKGPIWIIYPPSRDGDMQDMATRSEMVWQLEELEVR